MCDGYSGLRHAIDLLPPHLKLDRALVQGIDRDPKRAALVDALLRYAQHAGSHIVAEGVETANELETLVQLGVPLAQGFLLARPAPPWPPLTVAPGRRAIGLEDPATRAMRQAARSRRSARTRPPSRRTRGSPRTPRWRRSSCSARGACSGCSRATLGHRFGFALYGCRPVLGVADHAWR